MKLAPLLLSAGLLTLSACEKKTSTDAPATPSATPAAGEPGAAAPMPGAIAAPSDVAAPPADATKTTSGLAYKVLKKGTSQEHPNPWDSVSVHYTGWTTDGKMFDSSVSRGQPASFPVQGVIPGWIEGLQLMAVGDKFRLWVPVELAYKGRPGAPAGMLVFDVELLEIKPGNKPIPAPEDVAAPPPDAKKTATGIGYKVLKKGTETTHPGPHDMVKVHYTGWTVEGVMFDSSVQRGEPVEFPLTRVIPGWTEGVQLMSAGDQFRLWIPAELAYKDRPGAPQGMLVFDVELISFKQGPKPPEVPKDVAAPPKDAKKTASGLAYKVLSKGSGAQKPQASSTVSVHYSGWTTDGKMFDSSVMRGEPASFPLQGVIAGWTEGLQLMVVGERTRFWIPEALAYGGRPGAPAGMLVFDVELLSIEK